MILEEGGKQGIKVFPKSACAAKDIIGLDICYAHVNSGQPINLDLLQIFYNYQVDNDKTVLDSGTHGDCNFVRFITYSNPVIKSEKKERFLSCSSLPILISSSWFSWAQITPCEIKCHY